MMEGAEWLCDRCTFSNRPDLEACQMCTRARPVAPESQQMQWPSFDVQDSGGAAGAGADDDDGSEDTADFARPDDGDAPPPPQQGGADAVGPMGLFSSDAPGEPGAVGPVQQQQQRPPPRAQGGGVAMGLMGLFGCGEEEEEEEEEEAGGGGGGERGGGESLPGYYPQAAAENEDEDEGREEGVAANEEVEADEEEDEDEDDEEEDDEEEEEEDMDDEEEEVVEDDERMKADLEGNQKFTLGGAFQKMQSKEAAGLDQVRAQRRRMSARGGVYLTAALAQETADAADEARRRRRGSAAAPARAAGARGRRNRRVSYALYVEQDADGAAGLGADFLGHRWRQPSRAAAEARAREGVFAGGKASVLWTKVEDMGELGEGVQMYLSSLRYLAFAMLFAAVLTAPAAWLCGQNALGVDPKDMDYFRLAKYSVGNLGFNELMVANADCEEYGGATDCSGERMELSGLFFGVESVARTEATLVVTALSAAAALWFLLAFHWVRARLREALADAREEGVAVSDYAVRLSHLPRRATAQDILDHLDKLYNGSELATPRPVLLNIPMANLVGLAGLVTGALAGFGLSILAATAVVSAAAAAPASAGRAIYGTLVPLGSLTMGYFFRRTSRREQAARLARLALYGEDAAAVDNDLGDTLATAPAAVQVPTNTGLGMYQGTWVAEVSMVHRNEELLRKALKHRKALERLKVARARVQRHRPGTEDPRGPSEARERRRARQLDRLQRRLDRDENFKVGDREMDQLEATSGAFVIFNNVESAERCLFDYRFSGSWLGRALQPRCLQFSLGEKNPHYKTTRGLFGRGAPRPRKYKIKVSKAPEPSTVEWENLNEAGGWRLVRRAASAAAALVLLAVSFVVIFQAREVAAAVESALPALDQCDTALPALHFGTYGYDDATTLVRDDGAAAGAGCAADQHHIAYAALNYTRLPRVTDPTAGNASSLARSAVEAAAGVALCDSPCSSRNDDGSLTCQTLACAVPGWQEDQHGGFACESFSGANALVGCYCYQMIDEAVAGAALLSGLQQVFGDDLCGEVARLYATAWLLKFASAATITVVNALFQQLMAALGRFERHADLSNESALVGMKIFFLTYVNTALLVLLCNANFGSSSWFSGDYSTFSRGWYTDVGVQIAMTMLMNCVAPHVGPVAAATIKRRLQIWATTRDPSTQFEMNAAYEYPRWRIEARVAQLLCLVFVTLTYGGGLPLLYWFAAAALIITYWVDKYLLLRLCRRPPHYGPRLMQMIYSMLPWALLLHLAVTCYMFSNDALFSSAYISDAIEESFVNTKSQYHWLLDYVYPIVLRMNVYPLFCIFVIYFAWVLLLKKLKTFVVSLLKYMFGCCCSNNRSAKVVVVEDENGMIHEEEEEDDGGERKPKYAGWFMRLMAPREFRDVREHGVLHKNDYDAGWRPLNENTVYRVWDKDGFIDDIPHFAGDAQKTWEHLAALGDYSYLAKRSRRYRAALAFLSLKIHNAAQAARRNSDSVCKNMGLTEEDLAAVKQQVDAATAVVVDENNGYANGDDGAIINKSQQQEGAVNEEQYNNNMTPTTNYYGDEEMGRQQEGYYHNNVSSKDQQQQQQDDVNEMSISLDGDSGGQMKNIGSDDMRVESVSQGT